MKLIQPNGIETSSVNTVDVGQARGVPAQTPPGCMVEDEWVLLDRYEDGRAPAPKHHDEVDTIVRAIADRILPLLPEAIQVKLDLCEARRPVWVVFSMENCDDVYEDQAGR